jgi:bla regulator protein blaR1
MNPVGFISHPLVSAFGMALAHSLWQIVLIAFAWKLILYFSRNSGALIRYNVTLVSLIAIPCTFAMTFSRQLSLYRKSMAEISLNQNEMLRIFTLEENIGLPLLKQSASLARHIENYSPSIFMIYLIAVIILSAKSLLEYASLQSILAKNIEELPAKWKLRFEKLMEKAGIKKVPVYLTGQVSVPLVAGFFKPVILIPLAMFSSLDVRQVETILLHELYHIRYSDHHINMMQNIIEILFFFHPATWLIGNHLRRERENRVDELVVVVTNEPLIYAKALVTLETGRGSVSETAVAAIKSKNQLLSRITNIMNMKKHRVNMPRKTAAMLAILISGIFIAWVNPYGYENLQMEMPGGISQDPVEQGTQKSGSHPESELDELKTLLDENRRFESPPDLPGDPDPGKNTISETDTTVLRKELNLALEEMRREIQNFRSEEFLEEMRKARAEMKEAMKNFNSEEFREQMQQAQTEMREAMKNIDSEEFREQMRQAQTEMREAMKNFNSEEFKEQMRQVRSDMEKAMEQINSEEFRKQMMQIREEVEKAIQNIRSEKLNEEK